MPVPKRKHPRWRRDQKRAHIKLTSLSNSKCPNCGELRRPHRVCEACGKYGDVQVTAKA